MNEQEIAQPALANDELPSPPSIPTGNAEAALAFDVGAEEVESAQEFGEALPAGVYHFRVDKISITLKNSEDWKEEQLPQIQVNWKCQEEPHVGHTFTDWVPYVSQNLVDQSRAGNKAAQQLVKSRLGRIKMITEGCEYKIDGRFNPIAFFNTHPECKIQLSVKAGKTKDLANPGQYIDSGLLQNNAVKYIPLSTPTRK